jgi:hypothetical protein
MIFEDLGDYPVVGQNWERFSRPDAFIYEQFKSDINQPRVGHTSGRDNGHKEKDQKGLHLIQQEEHED